MREKLRPSSCLAHELGLGDQKDFPNRQQGWQVFHWISALAKRAVILDRPRIMHVQPGCRLPVLREWGKHKRDKSWQRKDLNPLEG